MSLVPPYIESLRPYEPGRNADQVRKQYGLAQVVKLASNENTLGPSPLALERVQQQLHSLHRYPNGGLELRTVLAQRYDVIVECVIVGRGSVGIIWNVIRMF